MATANICAEAGFPSGRERTAIGQADAKGKLVADVADKTLAGCRDHDHGLHRMSRKQRQPCYRTSDESFNNRGKECNVLRPPFSLSKSGVLVMCISTTAFFSKT